MYIYQYKDIKMWTAAFHSNRQNNQAIAKDLYTMNGSLQYILYHVNIDKIHNNRLVHNMYLYKAENCHALNICSKTRKKAIKISVYSII